MLKQKITPIILAGGQGKRLWPISYAARPKQFMPLVNGKSLFERALERCANNEIFNSPIIVGSRQHKNILDKICSRGTRVILEPAGKNTAPAIAIALNTIKTNETVMIMPADHFIADIEGFEKTAIAAQGQASREFLVTIGVPPTGPHTGYGYIQTNAFGDVEKFHEKPDKQTAELYIENPNMYWNSGIFTATPDTLIKEYQMHAPELLEGVLTEENFKTLKPISFDYAIAEKTFNAVMVEAEFAWNDIGDWNALISLKTGRL